MSNRHYIVCIHYYDEEDMQPAKPRLYYASTREQAKKRLEAEFKKTIAYAEKQGIDTSEANIGFDPWMSENKELYEIQADGHFFETCQIIETEAA